MKNSFTLSIPEPCHESWNEMTPQEKGRHCNVCAKTVVDFTRKTDREIGKIMKSEGTICGRFKKKQLERPISLSRKRDALLEMIPSSYAASLFIPVALLVTPYTQAQEQKNAPIEQLSSSFYNTKPPNFERLQGRVAIQENIQSFMLKGNVSDEKGPLPGGNVIIKGTTRGTQTDFDGNYELNIVLGETIEISFIGYETKEFLVDQVYNHQINTVLNYDVDLMGDIVITRMCAPRSDILNMTPPLEFYQSEERRKAKEDEKRHLEKVNAYKRYKKEQKRLLRKRNKQ